MSAVKTPQEKKRLSYEKDHVVDGGENDKAFRKSWPRKKAFLNRANRRKVAQVFVTLEAIEPAEAEASAKAIHRPKAKKWGVVPLGVSVTIHRESRIANHGARKARRARGISMS